MILDKELIFSDDQALAATDVYSTNVIDLGANVNIGRGYQVLRLYVKVSEVFAGGTSLTVTLRQSDAEGMGTPDTLATSGAVLTAALLDNAVIFDLPMPQTTKRYLALYYDVAGTFTTGKLFAALVPVTDNERYPAHTGLN